MNYFFLRKIGLLALLALPSASWSQAPAKSPAPPSPSSTEIISMSISAHYFPEPYQESLLADLDKMVPKLSSTANKSQAAALLYRYGKANGDLYLSRFLKRGDPTAATVYALNRVESKKPEVLAAFKRAPVRELSLALGKWQGPEVETALIARYNSEPHDASVALALAYRGRKDVLPLMEQTYPELSPVSDDKIYMAVAMARLNSSLGGMEKVTSALLEGKNLTGTRNPAASIALLDAVDYLEDKAFKPTYEKIIRNYLARRLKVSAGLMEEDVAIRAAQALATLKAVDSYPLLVQLFDFVQKNPQEDEEAEGEGEQVLSIWSPLWRLGAAIVQVDPQAEHTLVAKTLGEKWLSDERKRIALRPVPLPVLFFNDQMMARLG